MDPARRVFLGILGRNIARIRKGKKLTEAKMAERLGITVSAYQDIERGAVDELSKEQLDTIAMVLGTTTRALLIGRQKL